MQDVVWRSWKELPIQFGSPQLRLRGGVSHRREARNLTFRVKRSRGETGTDAKSSTFEKLLHRYFPCSNIGIALTVEVLLCFPTPSLSFATHSSAKNVKRNDYPTR